ncbi:MAG: hypothetical protein ACKO0U_06475 [Gammaproteobacteria bacterium]
MAPVTRLLRCIEVPVESSHRHDLQAVRRQSLQPGGQAAFADKVSFGCGE